MLWVSICHCAIFSHQSGEVEGVCVCAILEAGRCCLQLDRKQWRGLTTAHHPLRHTQPQPPQTLNLKIVCANFDWHVHSGKTDFDLWLIEVMVI
ncbi:hypothetical protein BDZ85DRAFT_259474 [Elsinoe ampelina]|uniref:Secreted protein n=1 Tax=Elsinoe ampelina TaxID=302913 RepID=A0A6A6GH11_9PEZI|nr:hypothetical protein BDZ85DRAFT_259474 [Elsinoe ampelina]